jgi:hypothetical protein
MRSGSGGKDGVGPATSPALSAEGGTPGASGLFQVDEVASTPCRVALGAALPALAGGRELLRAAVRWSERDLCGLLGGTTRGRGSTRSTAAEVAGAGLATGRGADGAGAGEEADRLRGDLVSVSVRGTDPATREIGPASESTVDVA